MRAITLHPEWAHAIAWLGKDVENRSRHYTALGLAEGEWVGIHAGAYYGGREGPKGQEIACQRLAAHGHSLEADGPRLVDAERCLVHRRELVAVARLGGIVQAEEPSGWYLGSMLHGWRLAEVHALEVPVAVTRGQLGAWRMMRRHVEEIRAQAPGMFGI